MSEVIVCEVVLSDVFKVHIKSDAKHKSTLKGFDTYCHSKGNPMNLFLNPGMAKGVSSEIPPRIENFQNTPVSFEIFMGHPRPREAR